jgi:multidrug transporter EmrE-like cation transporter
MTASFSLTGMILCVTSSQILLKFAGQHSATHASVIDGFVLNPWLWASLGASIIGIGFWLLTLCRLPLSAAYPWTALIYFITPLAGVWFFADALTGRYLFGLAFVLVGVLLTTRGTSSR